MPSDESLRAISIPEKLLGQVVCIPQATQPDRRVGAGFTMPQCSHNCSAQALKLCSSDMKDTSSINKARPKLKDSQLFFMERRASESAQSSPGLLQGVHHDLHGGRRALSAICHSSTQVFLNRSNPTRKASKLLSLWGQGGPK